MTVAPVARDPDALGQPSNETRVVKSVARAIRMIKAMAARPGAMTLSDVARAVDMSKPAAYHMLRTLAIEDFVRRTDDGRYELSWGLWEAGASVIRRTSLVQVARPHLDRLAKSTTETILLSIVDDDGVLYLDRDEITSDFTMVATTGRRTSFHANASGKIHLAHGAEDLIAAVLEGPLKAFTTTTITDPDDLRAELESVRSQGFATCWQEQEIGISSIAVPIRDHRGSVVAALALAGPAGRVNRRSLGRHVRTLTQEAAQIAQKLGATPAHTDDLPLPRLSLR